MKCPQCRFDDTRVIESRTAEEGRAVRRRRECPSCSCRFTTYERTEEQKVLWISKKDGRREAFDREKLIRGVSRSCEKLPVSLDAIEELAVRVENSLRSLGGEVSSSAIGELVMKELAALNKVAYVRFASVYREFTDLASFQAEIAALLEHRDQDHSAAPRR